MRNVVTVDLLVAVPVWEEKHGGLAVKGRVHVWEEGWEEMSAGG